MLLGDELPLPGGAGSWTSGGPAVQPAQRHGTQAEGKQRCEAFPRFLPKSCFRAGKWFCRRGSSGLERPLLWPGSVLDAAGSCRRGAISSLRERCWWDPPPALVAAPLCGSPPRLQPPARLETHLRPVGAGLCGQMESACPCFPLPVLTPCFSFD